MLRENNEIDIVPGTTMVKTEGSLMSESNIVNVVPMATEQTDEFSFLENNVETEMEYSEMTVEDPDLENSPFIPDVKPELQDDCLVFLPQRSMLKVKTVTTSEAESEIPTNVQESSESSGSKPIFKLKSISGSLSGNLSGAENSSNLQENKSTDNLLPSPLTNTTTMSTSYSVSPKVSELRADSKGHPSAPILGGPLTSGNKQLCIYYKTDANRQQITTITPVATRSNLTPKHQAAKVLSTAESLGLKSVFQPKIVKRA